MSGCCEAMGYFRREYGAPYTACGRPARYEVDGQAVCGLHRRRGRSWRVRIMECAEQGKSVTLKAEEVAEIAAFLARLNEAAA